MDLLVHAVAFEEALLAMNHAAPDFVGRDQARMVRNAFLDVMRESPAIYGAIAEAGLEPAVREYAGAMLAAWTRNHLSKDVNAYVRCALSGEDGESELVKATRLAWAERERAEREWVERGRPRHGRPAPSRDAAAGSGVR